MSVSMFGIIVNPDRNCIKCGHLWEIAEKVCPSCEFDPVGNKTGGAENDTAYIAYIRSKLTLPESET